MHLQALLVPTCNAHAAIAHAVCLGLGHAGDVPSLVIPPGGANVSGEAATASVVEVVRGSLGQFFAPLPTELTQLPVARRMDLRVAVNGAPAACISSDGVCTFAYTSTATPTVSGISPSAVDFSTATGLQEIAIDGTGFGSAVNSVRVSVGGVACSVTTLSDARLVCRLPDAAPAGSWPVVVDVEGKGFAAGAPNITLRTLRIDAVLLLGSGATAGPLHASYPAVLRLAGKGWRSQDCQAHQVNVAGVSCGVVSCGTDYLSVYWPGMNAAARDALLAGSSGGTGPVPVNVRVEVVLGGVLLDAYTLAGGLMLATTPDAAALALVAPSSMGAAGGSLTFSLDTARTAWAAGITSAALGMWLLPGTFSGTSSTSGAVARALDAMRPCRGALLIDAASGTGTCDTGPLPAGQYTLALALPTGSWLLAASALDVALSVTSVYPGQGSIGGGTILTITGAGFNAQEPSANVVLIPVPVSTTFLNGLVLCDVLNATQTQLTCRTRPHLATDASTGDPMARKVVPSFSAPGAPQVVLCDARIASSDTLKMECWGDGASPSAALGADSCLINCTFAYAWDATPAITSLAPPLGSGNMLVNISGKSCRHLGLATHACTDSIPQA